MFDFQSARPLNVHPRTARRRRLAGLISAASVIALLPSMPAAYAQTALSTPSAPSDEILVTARRHSESIEKVPTVVTAFGADQLEERSIHTETDLQMAVPGFTIRETEGQNQLTLAIRGQTVEPFTGSPSAVIAYVDEVQSNTGGASSFFDLDSIQVLKGPQGTLFGRNTTGGAVLFTTAKPEETFGGYLQTGYGNYDSFEEKGALNVPLIPGKLLLRAAFDAADRDGYITNLYYNTKLGKVDRQAGRLTMEIRPNENLKNTTMFEYDHSGGNNTGTQAYAITPCNAVTAGSCATSIFYSPALDGAIGFPGAWKTYLAANPLAYPGGATAYLAQQKAYGYWTVSQIEPSLHDEYDSLITNTTTYDLTSSLQIKNIFGYSESKTRDQTSETGSPFPEILTENVINGTKGNTETSKNISDELQLQGRALNDDLQFIVGGFYQKSDIETIYDVTFFDLLPLFATPDTSHFATHDTSEAVYAQSTYDLARLTGVHGLSFTGGFRYTFEKYTLDQLPAPYDANTPAPEQTVNFSNPSWTVALSYQATPDLLTYIQARRSWRSGGLNGVAAPVPVGAALGGDLFEPEYTRDVEIGAKFGGTVFGRSAHLNVAAYNQWVDNIQRAQNPTQNGQTISITVNVPAAEMTGVEVDGSVRPTDWLEVGLSGAINYARYTSNKALLFGTLYTFGPYADAPRLTGSLYGQVKLPAPENFGRMTVRADVYGQSGMYFSDTNSTITPGTQLPGYGLVNLRYDWRQVFGTNASLGAYVKNLLDKGYYTGGLAVASLGESAATVGVPRMFGVEVRYDF